MKLEKIILNGFKSFADKTEFLFNSPITAIVGPNGCGKSNVVDALKWVLGEQSTKSLRSGQMADVIFSGSASRKSMGMAEVSLFFSDTADLNIDQDELQVTRRLYRSGESDYLINNKSCRLKDVRELFMDTGVGVRAYSIIEQGQIAQLLTTSTKERRVIFEEAAGISKYKAHKKEALRKLERTEQNLLRLADIVSEVQRQLRSIKLQAGKARNFLQYSERLKELRVNYSLSQYHTLTTRTEKKKHALVKRQAEFATIAAEVGRNDSAMSQLSTDIVQTENQINQSDNALVAVKSKIDQHTQRIEFLRNRIEEFSQRKQEASAQIQKFQAQSKDFAQQLTQAQTDIEDIEKLIQQRTQSLEELQKVIHQVNLDCGAVEADLEDEKSGIIDIVRHTAQLHNEIQSINVYRNNLNGQKDRLSDKANSTKQQLGQLLTDKAQNQARLDDIDKVLAELQQSLEAKQAQMNQNDSDATKTADLLAQAKEDRSALQGEINVLTDMENKRQGLNNATRDILLKHGRGGYVDGIIADKLNVEADYAVAVEAALEGKTSAVIVNNSAEFLADDDIRNNDGRVRFICADRVVPLQDRVDLSQKRHVIGRLIEFVKYDSKYAQLFWHLLGKTIVVDSVDAAAKLANELDDTYSFVTCDGNLLNNEGIFSTGPIAKASGLISRKSRLNQLETQIGEIHETIEQFEEALGQHNRQNQHIGQLCGELRTAIYEANTEKTDIASKLNILDENIKRLSDEQPIMASEIDILEKQISESVQREYDSKQKLDELETVNTQRNDHIEKLEAALAEQKAAQQEKSAELTELKVSLGQVSEQRKALSQAIASLQSQLQHGQMALESAKTEEIRSTDQIQQSQANILKAENDISELFVDKEKAQQLSRTLHEKVESMLEKQKQTEQLLRQQRQAQSEAEEAIHQVKLDLSELKVKSEDLVQRVSEELQMDLAQSYKDYCEEDIDWESVKAEIAELKGKIARLGNVNVDAIDEQEELEKRNEFLSGQVEDLDNSKSQLQQLINKLNKECMTKFGDTFELIRGNFQELFRKLFGGGKADIVLENPEDVLESGIEIIARPPGKETRSISLLSGGEKTMTAIALLFAIFKTKPSPFCFLDEVDAALDEANNERFNLIVQEFQRQSQFVIITHAKRTMSIADVLFGVTMQQKGVSKKISVTFDSVEPASDETVPAAVA